MLARPLVVLVALAASLAFPAHASGDPPDLVVTALSVGPSGLASPYLRVTVDAHNAGGTAADAQLYACIRATTPLAGALGEESCAWSNPQRVAPGARATFTRDFAGFCAQVHLPPYCAGLTPMLPDHYRVTVTLEPRTGDARPSDNVASDSFSYVPFLTLP